VASGSFNIKADTRDVVDSLSNKLPAAYARESIPALEEIADGTVANIRRRKIWAKERRGILKKGLWRGNPKPRQSGAEIDMGWSGQGAAFGPGHEWNTFPASWTVKPVGIRTSTKNASTRLGQPIKMLRFMVGGRVVYSKGPLTIHPPRELKPHWAPALESYPVQARLGRALDTAIQRAGL